MTLYRTVLAEGQRDDLSGLLNRDLLLSRWPILRNLISRNIRDVWESAFPELRDACTPLAAALHLVGDIGVLVVRGPERPDLIPRAASGDPDPEANILVSR
jgi:hypothetical protein